LIEGLSRSRILEANTKLLLLNISPLRAKISAPQTSDVAPELLPSNENELVLCVVWGVSNQVRMSGLRARERGEEVLGS
jgi:hypothetical protein